VIVAEFVLGVPVAMAEIAGMTETDVVAVVVPFAFEAVRVKTVVEVGFTVQVPEAVEVLKEPGLMAMFVMVPVAFQERVDVPAGATRDGAAVKEEMVGGEPGILLTFTVVDAVEVLFEVSVENAQRVVEPLAVELVFHEMEYWVPLAVEVEPINVLLARLAPYGPS
jgi:hypothetical protein